MEPKFQTSFIPKSPISNGSNVGSTSFAPRPIGLLSLISNIILFVSILGAGGVFGYKYYLNNQLIKGKQSLELAKESFDVDTLNSILVTANQIKSAKNILNYHIAPSYLFSLLQKALLPKVTLKSLTVEKGQKGGFVMTAGAEALSYSVAAQQAEIFSTTPHLKNITFGNLKLNNDGTVSIDFKADVDESFLLYKSIIEEQQ